MKKADLKAIKADGNKLTKKVVNVLLDQGSTDEIESYMSDVLKHGCISGMVSELIGYNDTVEFYNKYKSEINEKLSQIMDETGFSSLVELFGDRWETEDPLVEDTQNQNLLAWFGFEETVREIMDQLEIEY